MVWDFRDTRGVPQTRLGKWFKTRLVWRKTVTTILNLFCKTQNWCELHRFWNTNENSIQRESVRCTLLQPRQGKDQNRIENQSGYSRGCVQTLTTGGQSFLYTKIYDYMTHMAFSVPCLLYLIRVVSAPTGHVRCLHIRWPPTCMLTMHIDFICTYRFISWPRSFSAPWQLSCYKQTLLSGFSVCWTYGAARLQILFWFQIFLP